jgi:transposase
LVATRDLAQRFGALVRTHSADALARWLADAENSEFHSFAAGLRQDEQAVRAALALP